MNNLKTAILIDGSDNPVAIRIAESERQAFISQGIAGNRPRNFRFVRPMSVTVAGEDEPRTVYLYRLTSASLSDADFEAMAASRADEFLNPEKYTKLASKPLTIDERAELETLRRQLAATK